MVPGATAQRPVGSGREGRGEGESFVSASPLLLSQRQLIVSASSPADRRADGIIGSVQAEDFDGRISQAQSCPQIGRRVLPGDRDEHEAHPPPDS